MSQPIPMMASGPGPTIRDQSLPSIGPRLTTNLRDFSAESPYQSSLIRNPSARTEIGNVRTLADRFDPNRMNPIESVYNESNNSPPRLPERSGSRMSRQNNSSLESLNNLITEMQQSIPSVREESLPRRNMTVGMPRPQRRPPSQEDPYQAPPVVPIKETSLDDIDSPQTQKSPKIDQNIPSQGTIGAPVSGWLSEKLKQINQDNWKVICPSTRTVGTETFELKLEQDSEMNNLKDRISELECQLKIKERELETNEYIAKELGRKLKNADELFDVRRRLENTERHFDDQVRMNQELTEENAKLMDEIAERNRKILQYQAELDNLDRIISSKNALDEEGLRKKLEDEIKRLSDDLQEKSRQLAIGHKEITIVHAEVKKKEKEIELRDHRIESLIKDMNMLRDRINEAEVNHAQAVSNSRSLSREKSVLQTMMDKKEPFNSILERLQDENTELKNYIEELEKKNSLLESSRDLAHALSQELKELNSAISDKNLAYLEKDRIAQTLSMVEKMLREKETEEESLRKELKSVQDYIYDLERENNEHRNVESVLKSNNELLINAEKSRVELAKKLATTQRRWARLSSACIERNQLLNDLLKECFNEMSSVNKQKSDHFIHEELPYVRSKGDIENIPNEWLKETANDQIRLYPKVQMATRKDQSNNEMMPLPKNENPYFSEINDFDQRKNSHLNPDDLYKYIGSGHRYSDWLAKIARNENVANKREPNLTPSNYNSMLMKDSNVYEDVSMDIPMSLGEQNNNLLDQSITEESVEKFQRPSPPREVRGRLVSEDDWLVEWSPPLMDENEISNGFKVAGYRLVINDNEVKRVASPWLCKALIKISSLPNDYNPRNSTAHLRNQICVQTVALTGHLSRPTAAKIENSANQPTLNEFLRPEED